LYRLAGSTLLVQRSPFVLRLVQHT